MTAAGADVGGNGGGISRGGAMFVRVGGRGGGKAPGAGTGGGGTMEGGGNGTELGKGGGGTTLGIGGGGTTFGIWKSFVGGGRGGSGGASAIVGLNAYIAVSFEIGRNGMGFGFGTEKKVGFKSCRHDLGSTFTPLQSFKMVNRKKGDK